MLCMTSGGMVIYLIEVLILLGKSSEGGGGGEGGGRIWSSEFDGICGGGCDGSSGDGGVWHR